MEDHPRLAVKVDLPSA